MNPSGLEIAIVGGLPAVRVIDPRTDGAMSAMAALMGAFGPGAIVDGDHESLAFDPGLVSVEDIEAVLTGLDTKRD